jgi:hypothetical protein
MISELVRFEVLTAVTIPNTIFLDGLQIYRRHHSFLLLLSPIGSLSDTCTAYKLTIFPHARFTPFVCLLFDREEGGSAFLRNIRKMLRDYIMYVQEDSTIKS